MNTATRVAVSAGLGALGGLAVAWALDGPSCSEAPAELVEGCSTRKTKRYVAFPIAMAALSGASTVAFSR